MNTVNQIELAEMMGISTRQVRNLVNKGILAPNDKKQFNPVEALSAYAKFKAGVPKKAGNQESELSMTFEEMGNMLDDLEDNPVVQEFNKNLDAFMASQKTRPYDRVVATVEHNFNVSQFEGIPDELLERFQDECAATNTVNCVLVTTAKELMESLPSAYHNKIGSIIVSQSFNHEVMEEVAEIMIEEWEEEKREAAEAQGDNQGTN